MVRRFDTKVGNIRLVTAPTSGARPYGIEVNSEGIPFFVEFGTNNVASIDPTTMQIREYPLPDPGARPRGVAITQDNSIWYTDFCPLVPGTARSHDRQGQRMAVAGRTQVATLRHRRHQRCAMVQRVIHRAEHDRALRPNERDVQSWAIPGGGEIVRNMAVSGDGNVALANSLLNEVGLIEIK